MRRRDPDARRSCSAAGIRRRIGDGLKLHPTIKIAARFPHPLDHDDVPMHRITEFSPGLTIGGSASRRGHVGLALLDAVPTSPTRSTTGSTSSCTTPPSAATPAGGWSRVPGLQAPLVTYRLTDGDLSRLARGLVHLGEALLAAGATELYPSIVGGTVVRAGRPISCGGGTRSTPSRTNLMTVHLTSTVRMGEDRDRTGTDSFGRVWGTANLRVNDASLLGERPA